MVLVTTKAIERLHEIAPGWDKCMLEHAYIERAKDTEEARNEAAEVMAVAPRKTNPKKK